jgi:drug/metabolite transporter (DMT)-like permease
MRAVLAMVVAAVLWSTGGLFIKVISLDAVSLAGWRSGIAAVALFAIARTRGHKVGVPRDPLSWLAAIAYAHILLLFVCATKLTTAANAIFLQYTAPMYVLLLEPLLLKTRFRARDLAFVGVAVAGMLLFFTGRIEAGGWLGNALALASGAFFAVFALAVRSRHDDAGARWTAVAYGNVVLCIGVALYFLGSGLSGLATPAVFAWPATTAESVGIAYLGVVQIGVSYALFAYAISKLSALESTLIGMIEPVLNPVWVFFGTGERPTPWAFLGAALIVGSVAARAAVASRDRDADISVDAPAPS